MISLPMTTLPLGFIKRIRVDAATGCWVWVGALRQDGYGLYYLTSTRRSVRAHRWAYEFLVAPIPDGLHLDHLCRNPPCVNPTHLEAVTPRVNNLRGVGPAPRKASQTHCVHGHPLAGDNLYIHPKRGTRHCRQCGIDLAAARRAGLRGTGTCRADGCDRPASSRGLCPKHYKRWWNQNRKVVAA